jgi:tRNA A-37 threonylcarbamoyl transferase component Bud32
VSGSGGHDASGPRSGPATRAPSPFSPDEWCRLEPLLDAILDAPPAHRPRLIAELSGSDPGRRAELERLVAECERSHPLLDAPATDRFAAVFGDERSPPPMPESLAGRYDVLREVGRGGMAIVYLARDRKHGRDVAVKVIRPDLAAAIGRTRFLREIEIAARLRHPHIVPLYDSGEVSTDDDPTDPRLYYVMPYETGHSLRDRLAQDGFLTVEDTVLILRDIGEALSHAHQHGIVHRDIKPDNVLLSGRHALVSDFGVARAVTAATEPATGGTGSTALGTPAYMAPEQTTSGAQVDDRADLYAVGVLAYELLAGTPPLAGGRPPRSPAQVDEVMDELRRRRPDAPTPLVNVIARCLAPRPDDRWQSADDLLAQLALVPAPMPATTAAARQHRSRWTLFGVAAAVVSVVVLAVAWNRARVGTATPLRLGRASQLTSERGLEVQPSISPDGQRVAYAMGNSLRMRIAVRPAAGGPARWLTAGDVNAWLPRWSPDGTRVLFLSRGSVFSVSALGGPAREEVASGPGAVIHSAAWSANGREIAYVRGDSLLARTVGSGRTRLVMTGPDLHSCSWSPDDAWIACVSGNSFYVTVGAVSGVGPMFSNLAPSRIVLVPAGGGRAICVTDSVTCGRQADARSTSCPTGTDRATCTPSTFARTRPARRCVSRRAWACSPSTSRPMVREWCTPHTRVPRMSGRCRSPPGLRRRLTQSRTPPPRRR